MSQVLLTLRWTHLLSAWALKHAGAGCGSLCGPETPHVLGAPGWFLVGSLSFTHVSPSPDVPKRQTPCVQKENGEEGGRGWVSWSRSTRGPGQADSQAYGKVSPKLGEWLGRGGAGTSCTDKDSREA